MVADRIFEGQRLPADGSQTPLYFEQLTLLVQGQLWGPWVLPELLPLPFRFWHLHRTLDDPLEIEILHGSSLYGCAVLRDDPFQAVGVA
jgi:hypothetical protein